MESPFSTQRDTGNLIRPACPSLWIISADQLKLALADLHIAADTHDGYGLALVSVWVGLVVWCDGERYWWRSGWDERHKRVVYAWHPAIEPDRAARRLAFRYNDVRSSHPLPELITGVKQ